MRHITAVGIGIIIGGQIRIRIKVKRRIRIQIWIRIKVKSRIRTRITWQAGSCGGSTWSHCCGFGMFIPDPDFYPSRISDLRSRIQKQQQKRGVKKLVVITFYVATNFTKLQIINYFRFEVPKKKIWANFQRIIELFTQKIVTKLSKIWVWDPGSEIRKKPILDPGSRGQRGTGSRIRIRNTAWSRGRFVGKYR
jgi:hypothetical protein